MSLRAARREFRQDPRQGGAVGRLREVRVESCACRLLLVLLLAEPCQRHEPDPITQHVPYLSTGVVPVQPSHPDVEQAHVGLVLPQLRERIDAVVGDSGVSPHVLDEQCRRIRRVLIVVDHQNSSVEPPVMGGLLSGGGRLRRRNRQLDDERAPSPIAFAARVQTSAVQFHQPACEREADTQSRL